MMSTTGELDRRLRLLDPGLVDEGCSTRALQAVAISLQGSLFCVQSAEAGRWANPIPGQRLE